MFDFAAPSFVNSLGGNLPVLKYVNGMAYLAVGTAFTLDAGNLAPFSKQEFQGLVAWLH